MIPAIPGIDLKKIDDNASKAFQKIAETRLTDYLRGLKIQAHNERMKALRLHNEGLQADARAREIEGQLRKVVAGDWDVIPALEFTDSKQADSKQDSKS